MCSSFVVVDKIRSESTRRTGSELTVRLPRFDPDDYERFASVHVHLVTNRLIITDCFHCGRVTRSADSCGHADSYDTKTGVRKRIEN